MNNILLKNQFGFRPGKGTNQLAIANVTKPVNTALEEGKNAQQPQLFM